MDMYNILRDSEFTGCAAALHHIAGIDWTQPVNVVEYHGTFTALKLRKAATAAGVEPSALLVCISQWDAYPKNKKWFAITADNKPVLSLRPDSASWGTCRPIDDYFNNRSFNEYRTGKWRPGDSDITTVIIAQDPQHAAPISSERTITIPRDSEPAERLHNVRVIGGRYNNISYVSQFDAVDDTGRRYHWESHGRCFCSSEIKPTELTDIIDKSGYYVHGRRESLKRQAARVKAEKARAAAAAVDLAPYFADVARALDDAIKATRAAYNNAATLAEFNALGEINNRWGGLVDLWKSCDRFTASAPSDYSSPEKIAERAAGLLEKLRAYTEKLNGVY